MGDAPAAPGQPPLPEADTPAPAEQLFAALSAGGAVEMPLQDRAWGAHCGSLRDRLGVQNGHPSTAREHPP